LRRGRIARGKEGEMSAILTFNAGSSSLKFAVYEAAAEPALLLSGQVENLGPVAVMSIDGDAKRDIGPADHAGAMRAIFQTIEPALQGRSLAGVGHRIVHGGKEFTAPILLDDKAMSQLAALEPLAPLHQPHNLAGIRAAQDTFPEVPQIGCFDTAFHAGHPFVNDTFGLPRRFYEKGVRRYGFHGLSYDYITSVLRRDWPGLSKGRVVVAHLGNGASMCAIQDGQSIGSTMGFSALDGLPMGTRCGQLDPGVILYLLEQGFSTEAITRILYKESGLKGISGLSHDMRTLLSSESAEAAEAIDYYVFRIQRELGAMAAVLGGIDGLVFCGGIGENAAPIRARVLQNMGFLGLELDPAKNTAGEMRIGAGAAEVLVIPTDEERVIARAVAGLLKLG
jgi:acetate kinase